MKKTIWIIITIIVVVILIYALAPLFKNTEIDEEIPTPQSMEEAMEEAAAEADVEADEEMPAEASGEGQTYEVVGTTGHPASGEVRIVEVGGETYVRYENFSTINGPNLHVYLAKDLEANEFIDLGPIKANMGNINYLVPEGVDISEYRYVIHWCVPFSVLFNYAEIG